MVSITKTRIESIDLLKGLVMIIMALDHVRDYFHSAAFYFNPSDPAQSTLPIFFTRFITHFCAPIFVFLAGVSACMMERRKTKKELSSFLIKRGLWLVFMEISLVTFAWQFDPQFRINGFAVIAVLGMSMILLAGLIYVPKNLLIVISSLVIIGHNLLDSVHLPGNFLWALTHHQELFISKTGFKFYMDYPIIPWFAVMALGYSLGSLYDKSVDNNKRRKIFNIVGLSAVILFFCLRAINVYGDPIQWKNFDSVERTVMSFFNLTKYPPSLLYLLITLGAMFLFLANTEHLKGRVVSFFCTFGRVPFFYYLVHLYIIHLLAIVFAKFSGFGWKLAVLPDWIAEMTSLRGYGFSLVIVYLVWAGVITITYFLCKWYDKYKSAHPEKWWLSYL